jgi:ketosteroid isomerase-like protein
MSNPKARAAALNASPEDAEAQFYDALRDGDLERVMAVWADDDDVVCVHPGGTRLVGPQAVRAAFESIFANGHIAVHP